MYSQLKALNLHAEARSPMKHWWTVQETLKPGLAFTGEVQLDERLLHDTNARKVLGWNAPHQRDFAIEHLIQAANTFTNDICAWELDFFEKHVTGIEVTPVLAFYRELKKKVAQAGNTTCYLCIGQGAGWHKMTIGMLLERAKDFDFNRLRKHLRLADKRLGFEFPKSRKLLMKSDNEIQNVFGWLKVRFL